MPEYRITYRPDADRAPEVVDADDVTLEGESHLVFRRTQLVIGRPRQVVARRIVAAGVLTVDECPQGVRPEDMTADPGPPSSGS